MKPYLLCVANYLYFHYKILYYFTAYHYFFNFPEKL